MIRATPAIRELDGSILYREATPGLARMAAGLAALGVATGSTLWISQAWIAQDWSHLPQGLSLVLAVFFFLVLPFGVTVLMAVIALTGPTELRLDPASGTATLVRNGPFRWQRASFAVREISAVKALVLDNATDTDIVIALALPDGSALHLAGFHSIAEARDWAGRIARLTT